jgi:hypothetical protein
MRVTGVGAAQQASRHYLQAVEQGVEAGLAAGGKAHTEPWERSHHPWSNRSEDAEKGLHTFVEPTNRGYALVNQHGVPYGRFLELKHDGRFAVLTPALRATWRDVLATVGTTIRAKVGA